MMIAKEMCEKINEKEVVDVLNKIEANNGVYKVNYPFKSYDKELYFTNSYDLKPYTKIKLLELGYKIEEKEVELIGRYKYNFEEYKIRKYKYFGPFLYKKKFIDETPIMKTFKYTVISACCKEE